MRRLAMVAGLGLVFGWVAVPAWGHAGFESPKEVMADTDQTITQSVPEERGPDLHNAKVIVEVPAGFEVKGCHGEGWECSTAPAANSGATLVRFTGTGPRELFRYDVHTPAAAGDYAFKVSQTYTDGTIVVWDGPATSDKPAAVLKVVAGHEHHPGTGEAVCAPEGVALAISAQGNQFDKDCLAAPAGVPFTIAFTSHDSEPHNVVIHRHGATSDVLFKGELFTGPKTVTYSVGPLPAGTYHFHCEVHPAMAGTFVVAEQHAGEHATTPPADMQHPPAASPTPTAPQVPPAAAASPAPPAAHAAPAGDGETGTPRPAAAAGQLPRTGTGSDRPLAVWAGLVLALGGFAVMTGAARPARQR